MHSVVQPCLVRTAAAAAVDVANDATVAVVETAEARSLARKAVSTMRTTPHGATTDPYEGGHRERLSHTVMDGQRRRSITMLTVAVVRIERGRI